MNINRELQQAWTYKMSTHEPDIASRPPREKSQFERHNLAKSKKKERDKREIIWGQNIWIVEGA